MARRVKEGNERERQIQPVNSSLSVLHRLKHTEIHRVWKRREWGERRQKLLGGDKRVSKGGESNQASNLALK